MRYFYGKIDIGIFFLNFKFLVFLFFFKGCGVLPVILGLLYQNVKFRVAFGNLRVLNGGEHGAGKTGIIIEILFGVVNSELQLLTLVILFLDKPLTVVTFKLSKFVVVLLRP